jgi:hypothetical protein
MVDLGSFLRWEYWTEGFVGSNALYYTPSLSITSSNFWVLLWFFVGLIIAGSGVTLYRLWTDDANPLKKRLSMISSNFITIGLLGLAWFMSRMLNFRFLSGRFVLLGILVYLAIVLFLIARYAILFFPIEWKYYQKHSLTKKS